MKFFWTLLFFYFVYWFINNLFSSSRKRTFGNQNPPQNGKTTIKVPPEEAPKKFNEDEGEYIDYKEVKD